MVKRRKTSQAKDAIVVYVRVSTVQQGRPGLGRDAQMATVKEYCKANKCVIDSIFEEVESGKRADRPELAKAIDRAQRTGATLVCPKLDRLARNTAFLMGIVESGINVLFLDFPNVTAGPQGKFMIAVMASVAELEAGLISERTKAALRAYRDRGGLLGGQRPECRNLTDEARQRGARAAGAVARASAIEADAELAAEMLAMEREGMSLRQSARALSEAKQ